MTTFSPHTVGQRGDAQVDLAAAVHDRHAAVLRLAALGDVDVAHDLEAGDDAVLDALGRALHRVQHPVDAVPHPHVVLGRLDVDVGRVVLDRLAHEQVHETHDGSVVLGVAADAEVGVLGGTVLLLERRGQVAELVVGADVAVDRGEQVGALGDGRGDLHPCGRSHIVDGEDVARVRHREDDLAVGDADGQNGVAPADGAVDEGDGCAVDRVVDEFDEREAGLCCARLRQLDLGDRAAREEFPNGRVVCGRLAGHRIQVLDRQMAMEDQDLGHRGHGGTSSGKDDVEGRVSARCSGDGTLLLSGGSVVTLCAAVTSAHPPLPVARARGTSDQARRKSPKTVNPGSSGALDAARSRVEPVSGEGSFSGEGSSAARDVQRRGMSARRLAR